MTQTADEFEQESFELHQKFEDANPVEDFPPTEFPTEWHMIDAIAQVECRNLSADSYEIRTSTTVMTLTKEGFDLYRDDTLEGRVIFADWFDRNHIVVRSREAAESVEVTDAES